MEMLMLMLMLTEIESAQEGRSSVFLYLSRCSMKAHDSRSPWSSVMAESCWSAIPRPLPIPGHASLNPITRSLPWRPKEQPQGEACDTARLGCRAVGLRRGRLWVDGATAVERLPAEEG